MPEFAREFEEPFVRLRAAVAEKHFAGRDEIHDGFSEASLRLVIIKIGDMHQLARLLNQRLGDGWMRVAERGHGDAAAEVEVTLARDVVNVTAGAVAQRDVKTALARHDVLLEQRLHGSHIVAHDGRW